MADLTTLSFPTTLDSSTYDIIQNFFIPALSYAKFYDRGVGFFSSGWLRISARGIIKFAANGGQGRWVTSPILDENDWEALQMGDAARYDPVLREALLRNIENLTQTLEEETLSALAWLIADEVLTFKLALPQNKLVGGEFHDKFGVFTDNRGNRVSFNGSYNESMQGTRNYESIKIFCSWEPAFLPLVQADVRRFEKLWNNQDPNVRVFDLPEAAREKILKLRKNERPYPEPEWIKIGRHRGNQTRSYPRMSKDILLRDYQQEAIEAWFAHDCRGLLEMATGTGKTITALAASVELYERERRLAIIITTPYQHLVDQWQKEAETFGYRPLLAYRSKARWVDDFNHEILEYNNGYRDFISVITTHTTFASQEFQTAVHRLTGLALVIADEVHHLGTEHSRKNYPEHVTFRLALSATPDRWFDDVGTAAIREYFGPTVFVLSLEQAIGISLTPYYYYPHLVSMTDEELKKYEELSAKIAKLAVRQDEEGQEALKMLLIKRAQLLNTAANKLPVLGNLIDEQEHVQHALFYCAPQQIDDVLHLLGREKRLLVHRFTAREDTLERQQLLTDFADGRLNALVAMKCLDEGVDVPNTQTAFFLASSGNPREFVQRRGRILRKSPNKDFSVVHDLITVPPAASDVDTASFQAERSIMRRELQRFKEFANPAFNKHQALDIIWDIAGHYGLMDF